MPKKKKNKKNNYTKHNIINHWDSYFFSSNNNYIPIKTCSSTEVHEIAIQVFGSSYYIDFSSSP